MADKVVVHLLPQDATIAEKEIVLAKAHKPKQGQFQSADDVAWLLSRGRDDSYVVVWDAERWRDGDIGSWLKEKGVNNIVFSRFETVWP